MNAVIPSMHMDQRVMTFAGVPTSVIILVIEYIYVSINLSTYPNKHTSTYLSK